MDGLTLYHNRLSGTIPSTLSNFTDLSTCELTSSQCLALRWSSAGTMANETPSNARSHTTSCIVQQTRGCLHATRQRLNGTQLPVEQFSLWEQLLCYFACMLFAEAATLVETRVRRRLSRALLLMVPHIEMAAGTSRDSLASQDALQAMMGYAADGIEAGHGPSIAEQTRWSRQRLMGRTTGCFI